jgi:hypothetical protein
LPDPVLCCTGDEGRPLGAAMQVEASNRHKLLWSKAMVVSVDGKGAQDASGVNQEGEHKLTDERQLLLPVNDNYISRF